MALRIHHLSGSRAGTVDVPVQPVFNLGRDSSCAIAFDPQQDLMVSARHAEIAQSGAQHEIRDLSRLGTFINGEKVSRAVLKEGDVVELGPGGPRLRISIDPVAAAASQPQAPAPEARPRPVAAAAPEAPSRRGAAAWVLAISLTLLVGIATGVAIGLWYAGFFASEAPLLQPIATGPTVIDVPSETRVETVGVAGGRAELGGASVAVPRGALQGATPVAIKRLRGPFPAGRPAAVLADAPIALGAAYDFGPPGQLFRKPVTVTLPYDEKLLPAGHDPSGIRLAYFDGHRWVLAAGDLDTVKHTVTVRLTSFPGWLAVAIYVAKVIVTGGATYLIWTKTGALEKVTDLARGEIAKEDPVSQGTASRYITPDDPDVRRRAEGSELRIEGSNEGRRVGERDLGRWLEQQLKDRKAVRLAFGGGPGGRAVFGEYDEGKGSNWQKPSDYFSRGSDKGALHGDCTDMTNAAVSVLIAKGYKARGVFGYGEGDKRRSHAWGEVIIDGKPYYIDEVGGILPLEVARDRYKYQVPSDPSDPRYRSSWDDKGQEKYDPGWVVAASPDAGARDAGSSRDLGQAARERVILALQDRKLPTPEDLVRHLVGVYEKSGEPGLGGALEALVETQGVFKGTINDTRLLTVTVTGTAVGATFRAGPSGGSFTGTVDLITKKIFFRGRVGLQSGSSSRSDTVTFTGSFTGKGYEGFSAAATGARKLEWRVRR